MMKTYTIVETLIVSKTVEIEIPEDAEDWDIEQIVKGKAYKDTIIGNSWSIDDCVDVEIYEEMG